MKAMVLPYRPAAIPSFLIFTAGLVAAIADQEPLWLLVSFGWLLLPVVFQYLVVKTENIFWLLLITLPLSTELNITPQLGLDFPDELLLILLTGMAIVKWLHQPQSFPVSAAKHPLFFVLIIYIFWVLISCMYAAEPVLAVKYLLAKTWYIIPLVILPQVFLLSMSRISKMVYCLLVPMLFVVLQSLVRHALYGFTFKDVQQVLAPFFRNHVNYSSMLVCLLPVAWAAWKLTPAESSKRKWIRMGMLTGLTGLLFAYSRGAWVALLAGIAMVWIIRKKLTGVFVVVSVFTLIISITWLVTDKNYMRFTPDHDHTIFHTDFSEHMQATLALKDVSAAERFYRWVAGARMLADKPVTGFGPNAFYPHYRPYTLKSFETWVSDNPEHSTVHNYFLLVALEQGLIGLVLFGTLFFGMLLRVQKLYHRLQSRFYKTSALVVAMMLIMIAVINSMSDMIETDKIGALFWLCLGMIILLDSKSKEEKEALA